MSNIQRHDPQEGFRFLESFANRSIEGNRLAEVCGETLLRLLNGRPISQRYLPGLAWTIRNMGRSERHETG
jgi:hypothetical protein